MIPEDAERVLDLFTEARACPPEQRAEFLAQACAGNDVVRAEIESLLGGEAPAATFLGQPAFEHGLEVIGETQAAGDLQAGDTVGDCRVHSLLGVGGMGEVYLADDLALGRRVALKLIQRGRSGTLLSHFRHERRVLAGLTHPNIARLYGGAVTPEGRAYLVMEYVEGERLDRYCDDHGLGISERLALFRKVCAAVSYAHQNLVVHRDLKPANIRVTPEGEPKLLDFGIAKLLDTETTSHRTEVTATMSGAMTPEYASPEQLRGETITTASDVYSLGVVLYELLCGQRPYALKSRRPDELARAICEVEPPRVSTAAGRANPTTFTATVPVGEAMPRRQPAARLRRRLEGDLDNIVAKALRKEPTRRYPSVAAFSEDIRRHCEGLPVTARKDTLAYRAGKFVRRNNVSVGAGALVVLTLVGGLVFATWQAELARQQRDRAQVAQARAEAAQKQAERINGFLQQLLGSASPRKMGKDVKVVQVLDAAGANVDQQLAREPEVLAQVHRTLGDTYQGLGLPQPAEVHRRAAFDLLRRLHGADDERTVNAAIDLAYTIAGVGHNVEAESLLRGSLAWLHRQSPVDQAKLIKVLHFLGYCLLELHRNHEAQAALDEALSLAAKAEGVNSTGYADILMQSGNVKRYNKDPVAAAALFQRTVAIYARNAPNDPNLVLNEFDLCLALLEQQKFAESKAEWESAMRDCVRIMGNNNRWSMDLGFVSEIFDFTARDFAKVVAEGKQTLDLLAAAYQRNDGYVVTARYLLGASLTRTGHAVEGEPLLREALAQYDRSAPAFLFIYGNIASALGDCLFAQGRYAEAEPLLLTGYDEVMKHQGEPELKSETTHRLRDFYLAWNKPVEATRFASIKTDSPAPSPSPSR